MAAQRLLTASPIPAPIKAPPTIWGKSEVMVYYMNIFNVCHLSKPTGGV